MSRDNKQDVRILTSTGVIYTVPHDVGVDFAFSFTELQYESLGVITTQGDHVIIDTRHVVSIVGVTEEDIEAFRSKF